jgi:hypothetical protein
VRDEEDLKKNPQPKELAIHARSLDAIPPQELARAMLWS